MEWYLKVLKSYSDFRGRARRKEYWMFALFNLIAAIVAVVIDNILGTTIKIDAGGTPVSIVYGYIYIIYVFATLIPGLAVMVRRLHDVGKSGWFSFIVLIPIAGPIWMLVLLCTDGQLQTNQWGPNPKGNFDAFTGFGQQEPDQVV